MPIFGAVQTPTTLSSGDKLQVINSADTIASGSLSMAVSLEPQPTQITMGIYNNSGQSISLVASPDFVSGDYLPVYNTAGTAVTVPNGQVWLLAISPGLQYAVKAGAQITSGSVWLTR